MDRGHDPDEWADLDWLARRAMAVGCGALVLLAIAAGALGFAVASLFGFGGF